MNIKHLFGEKIYPPNTNLRCPFCGFDFSHVRGAHTRLGSDEVEADIYEGTVAKGTTKERRSALVIVIDGECGHSWEIVLQQDKGITLVQVERCEHRRPMH